MACEQTALAWQAPPGAPRPPAINAHFWRRVQKLKETIPPAMWDEHRMITKEELRRKNKKPGPLGNFGGRLNGMLVT